MYTSNRTVQTRWGWLEIVIVLVMASLIGVAALFLSAPTTARAQGGSVYLPLVSTGQGAGTMTPDNVVPNEYIVVLRDFHVSGQSPSAVTVADAARTLTDVYGGEILYTYESALRGFAVTTTDEAAAAMAGDPAVALVEPNRLIQIDDVGIMGTQTNATWGLDRLDQRDLPLNDSYSYNNDGAGVHVYIIDTGVRTSHEEFTGRIGNGATAIADGRGVEDCHGHGTHVAGTVGGSTYGVAKGVTIHPVRVLNCSGSGTTAAVIAGVDWVTNSHIKPAVANMSLGGSTSTALDTAVRNSINAGVTYAVAAGNSNINACNTSPGRVDEALTVGASQSNDTRASYSNYGSCLDLFAPGSSILSAGIASDTSTATMSGTSMATPHVTGAASLYLAANPSASPAVVGAAIVDTATTEHLTSIASGSPNRLLYTMDFGISEPPTATPTPTPTEPDPTPTPSPEPTETPTPTPETPALCVETVANGGFEAGNNGWAESSSQGFPLVCDAATCGAGLAPYEGAALAWLGGANRERSLLSQTVTIPGGQPAVLNFRYRIESEEPGCGYDQGYVRLKVGNSLRTLYRYNLCTATNTGGWAAQALDLSSYAGQTVRLDFYVSTDRRYVSSLFVDAVSLASGAACTVAAADAPSALIALPLDEEFVEPVETERSEPEVSTAAALEYQR